MDYTTHYSQGTGSAVKASNAKKKPAQDIHLFIMDLRQGKIAWLRCYKNVYKIFAFKKGNGAPLYSGDNVMFYLVNTKTWLNGEGRVEGNNQCPESAPPHRYKFDECSHEIFTIIKR